MARPIRIAPSILSADFGRLAEEAAIKAKEEAEVAAKDPTKRPMTMAPELVACAAAALYPTSWLRR